MEQTDMEKHYSASLEHEAMRSWSWCDEHIAKYVEDHYDDPIMKRAMLLAEGKGSAEDKRDHLQDLIRMARGYQRPCPITRQSVELRLTDRLAT
jgi:hypothetical protein